MVAAGVEGLQFRDLRRTAAVRLAEAGCTVPEIAAITGHTIDTTARILEAYLPRNFTMARAAIVACCLRLNACWISPRSISQLCSARTARTLLP